jgi:hypothetical protein
MTIQRPLVPEDIRRDPVATLTRAALCVALAKLDGRTPVTEFAKRWREDRQLDTVLRAAVSPASIASTPALAQTTVAFLATLVPVSAGADLLNRALGLSFDGAAQISVPAIAVPNADFVAEMAPIPVQQAATSPGPTLLPHKLAVITSLTGEMMRSSNAEALVRIVLAESTGPAIDRVLFSSNAAAADRPAGIMNGIAPLTPAGPAEKATALVDDLQTLATAVAAPSAMAHPPAQLGRDLPADRPPDRSPGSRLSSRRARARGPATKSEAPRDLINVRFGPLCGLRADISRRPRSANSGCEQSQQKKTTRSPRRRRQAAQVARSGRAHARRLVVKLAAETPEMGKFPVNFPVSREFGAEAGSHPTASSGTAHM